MGLSQVKTVSAEECELISPWDIVLPVPGHSATLPRNESEAVLLERISLIIDCPLFFPLFLAGNIYSRLLKDDDLSLSSFEHRIKDYSARGDYRKVFVRPKDLSWKFERYEDSTIPLTLSDFDLLNAVAQPKSIEGFPFVQRFCFLNS